MIYFYHNIIYIINFIIYNKMSVKYWYYQINAREGLGGFADDVEYQSDNFNSFKDCYKSYINFFPSRHWKNLRHKYEIFVYVNDGVEHINKADDGMLYYDNPETEIGITDYEFDEIIKDITKNN